MEYEEVKIEKKEERTDSYFDGKFIEYLGYKLLALLITLVTFLIAKPWADKLLLEYKINHSVYNGKRLKFEGKGTSLFVQRFKWFLLTLVTFGIYAWWIPIKMEQWIASNTHFEDEDLVPGESFFDGKILQMIGVNLFTNALTIISFGLLFPFGICYKQKWIAKHTVINRKRIKFDGKAVSLIGHYLLWWLLSVITFGIYALWLPIKVYGWQVKRTHIKLKDEEDEKTSFMPMIVGIVLIVVIITLLAVVIPKSNIASIISGDKPIEDLFKFGKQNGGSSELSNPFYKKKETVNVTLDSNGGGLSWSNNYKIGDKITSLTTPVRSGYTFIRWEDKNGKEITNGYEITGPLSIKAVWKKETETGSNQSQVVPQTPVSKCNDGYVYESVSNHCYLLSDQQSAETRHTYDDNGEIIASGIWCPDGYEINFEVDQNGECIKYINPNY